MTYETWKAVVGYEGIYEISDLGNMRSVPRIDIKGVPRGGHQMKFRLEKAGYYSVSCYLNGVHKRKKVHVLVAEAFIGPRPSSDLVCRHLNDIKTDNVLTNLAWGTHKQNKADSRVNGTMMKGEKSHLAKLTVEKVREIRTRSAAGEKGADLGREFGVNKETIYAIVKRRAWKDA